jgi:hypothetical protein
MKKSVLSLITMLVAIAFVASCTEKTQEPLIAPATTKATPSPSPTRKKKTTTATKKKAAETEASPSESASPSPTP